MNVLERARTAWELFCEKPLTLLVDASLGDGLHITPQEEGYEILAGSGQEALHGVMELIRLCRLGQAPEAPVEEHARFSMRMLWSWSRIESTYRHSPYWNYPSMLRPELMEDPENQPEMQRFLHHAASMGINALTLMHELHHSDLGDYDQHLYLEYYKAAEEGPLGSFLPLEKEDVLKIYQAAL
ncbi:MAG: hypothetical protein HFG27_11920 [Provencibacterium sp.]|jgi:hypothetical protein|nr:hypothetical protein [Provencibacterium sp.]